jgi:hypothetical protein
MKKEELKKDHKFDCNGFENCEGTEIFRKDTLV